MKEARTAIEQNTSGYSYTYLPQIGTYQLVVNDGECYRINTVTGETHKKYGENWLLIKESVTEQA